MQKIDISKKYRTRSGFSVEILKTDLLTELYPVIAIINKPNNQYVLQFTEYGIHINGRECEHDLIEVNPYEDFVVDEPVMVRDKPEDKWSCAFFAGISIISGKPTVWPRGTSSWTAIDKQCSEWFAYNECRRPTPEELA